MFIISAGMPKSGSTLFSLYQKDILERLYPDNGQRAFEELIKAGKVNGIGIFVYDFESPETLNKLIRVSEDTGPFIIKTHVPLTMHIRNALVENKIMATYIHRDPRDVVLSAIDHGNRPADHPARNSFFLQFDSVEHSIPIVKDFCRTGMEWVQSGLCEIFTYHDLMVNPIEELIRFCEFINIVPDEMLFSDLIRTYAENPVKGKKQYNTGKLQRYLDEMLQEEIELCNLEMAEELKYFGYGTIGFGGLKSSM